MTPSDAAKAREQFAVRLGDLRGRISAAPAALEASSALSEARPALGALQSESEGWGRSDLAAALRRLSLMTDVWECLAADEDAVNAGRDRSVVADAAGEIPQRE